MKKIYERHIKKPVVEDLKSTMVFIGGPRQTGKTTFALNFLPDTDKREIDFVVLKEGAPLFAVECKAGDKNIAPSIYYFMERTPIPKFYRVHGGNLDYEKNNARVIPVHRFCKELDLP